MVNNNLKRMQLYLYEENKKMAKSVTVIFLYVPLLVFTIHDKVHSQDNTQNRVLNI